MDESHKNKDENKVIWGKKEAIIYCASSATTALTALSGLQRVERLYSLDNDTA